MPHRTDAGTTLDHTEHTLRHLREVARLNAERITTAATRVLDCVRADGLVHTAGAGHSLAGVLESFYRAGGLAAVRPLYHPDLLPLHGATSSTAAERTPGLAERVLAEADFRGGTDVLVVFSNSGINPYPVELAATARAAGSTVIAVTSPTAAAAAPPRAASTLAAQADVVLDTLVPGGDASHPPAEPVTAPLSSLANVLLWNQLLVRAHELAEAADLPLWRSSNVPDGDEANRAHLERYQPRIPALG
ncbi:sugar isomerase domain-containing protein [Saccharopolyspora sp. CA-218241]|uniref:sugar isomerase domain-containing protein n=1 Tax=Saccharopolyspora sp. CA-218241 TaxID=3240027 RepID=UPI003D97DB27